jgi:uncharacterized protein YybS (DUF2232 family)
MGIRIDDRRGGLWLRLVRATGSTLMLYLAGFVLPFGGPVLMLFAPQPALRVREEGGPRALAAVVAITAALAAVLASPAVAVFFALSFGLMALVLGILLDREWSIELTIGLVSAVVGIALLLAALAVGSPAEWVASTRVSLDQVRHEALQAYAKAGLSAEVLGEVEKGSVRLIDVMMRLLPALSLGGIALVALLNVALLRRRQRAAGAAPVFGDLTRWKCPPELVWVLIASGYTMFLPAGVVQRVAMNVFAVLAAVYFCQGLVIAQFYMRRWHSPIWINGLVYLFILIEWLLATGVTLVGVFDLWADFRRLNPRPVEED